MEDDEKVQLVSEAASLLFVEAQVLRSTGLISLAVQGLIAQLSLDDVDRLQPEIQAIIYTIKETQRYALKSGASQMMFIEELKEKFELGQGKPKNVVRKGNLRKKY